MSLFTYNNVLFDKDIAKLNYQPDSLQAVEQELNSLINTESKSLYVVSYGNRQEEALAHNQGQLAVFEKLTEEQKLLGYSTIAGVVLDSATQRERIKQWQIFWKENGGAFKEKSDCFRSPFGFKPETFNQFYAKINSDQTIYRYQHIRFSKGDYQRKSFLANKKDFLYSISIIESG